MNKSVQKATVLALALTMGLGISGCATNQDAGTAIGAVLGGIAASHAGRGRGKTAATIVGTLAGAYIGGRIGKYMDDTDQLKAQQTLERNPTNYPTSWRNPDSGYEYTMTPTRTYQTAEQQYCREYQSDVVIGGRREHAYGTACRQPDGSWQVM